MLTLFSQCSSDEQTAMACFDRLLHESIQANTVAQYTAAVQVMFYWTHAVVTVSYT